MLSLTCGVRPSDHSFLLLLCSPELCGFGSFFARKRHLFIINNCIYPRHYVAARSALQPPALAFATACRGVSPDILNRLLKPLVSAQRAPRERQGPGAEAVTEDLTQQFSRPTRNRVPFFFSGLHNLGYVIQVARHEIGCNSSSATRIILGT